MREHEIRMFQDLRKVMEKQKDKTRKRHDEMTQSISRAFEDNRAEPIGHHLRMDVAEICSPPRVTDMAARMELEAGWSFDLTTTDENGIPWDFSKEERRKAAMERVPRDEPLLLIGSPMFTNWSTIMNVNWDRIPPGEKERRLEEARVHLKF